MPYPKNKLFFTQTKSNIVYSSNPSGQLDFVKLTQGQANCWINPGAERALEKKHLLLCDWRAGNWLLDKQEEIKALFKKLLKEGFQIYLWQAGEIERLQSDEIEKLNHNWVRQKITVNSNHEMKTVMSSTLNISQDQIFLMDAIEIEGLLLDTPLENQEIECFDLVNSATDNSDGLNNREEYLIQKFKQLKDNHSELNTSLIDSYGPDEQPLKKIASRFPDIIKKTISRSYKFDSEKKIRLLLKINEEFEKFDKIEKILDIRIDKSLKISQEDFNKLIKLYPNIKKIHTPYFPMMFNAFKKEPLVNLEEIQLHSGEYNFKLEEFNSIIKAAPNIKTIKICGSIEEVEDSKNLALEENALSHLEQLYFIDNFVKPEDFAGVIKAAPNLKFIQLPYFQDSSTPFSLQENVLSLNQLEKIRFDEDDLNDDIFICLIKSAPNLKIMEVFNIPDFNWPFELEMESNSLQEICLKDSCFYDTDAFKEFLLHGPNIKKANHIALNKEGEWKLDLKPNSLKNLEEISISTLYFEHDDIKNLFEAAPNLQSIILKGSPLYLSNLKADSLTKLQEIVFEKDPSIDEQDYASYDECYESYLNSEVLRTLLDAAPNLKSLAIKIKVMGVIDDELMERLAPLLKKRELAAIIERNQYSASAQIEQIIDADTAPSDTSYSLKKYFYPIKGEGLEIAVNNYRLCVFDKLWLTEHHCSANEAFKLSSSEAHKTTVQIKKSNNDCSKFNISRQSISPGSNYYYAKKKYWLNNSWQALPSISPNEKLLQYHLNNDASIDIDVAYSANTNLYYIRSKKTPDEIEIDFILEVPSIKTGIIFPEKIQRCYQNILMFSCEALNDTKALQTGLEHLRAIQAEKKGACRHRAVLFKKILDENGYIARIITNECHAFVEVKNEQGEWITLDLGGYPAELKIKEDYNPILQQPVDNFETLIENFYFNSSDLQLEEKHDTPQVSAVTNQLQLTKYFKQRLSIWDSPQEKDSVQLIRQHIDKGNNSKILINIPDSEAVSYMVYQLQAYCKEKGKPYFFINYPDEVVCSAPYTIINDDDTVNLYKGSGGVLHDFLTKKHNVPVRLIINYDNFKADDIVRLNALIDKEAYADGTPLPEKCQLIGVANPNKPDAYRGADFYSRFDSVEQVSIDSLNRMKLPVLEGDKPAHSITINLFNAPDWKSILLGHIVIDGHQLYFKQGKLQAAIEQWNKEENPLLIIENGPWDNKAFQAFWQSAILEKKIAYLGRVISLPDNLKVLHTKGQDFAALSKPIICVAKGLSQNSHILNPETLADFFGRYQCNNNDHKTITPQHGFIEQHKGECLVVSVSHELNLDTWARFLSLCIEHKVRLNLHMAPGVQLPDSLQAVVQQSAEQDEIKMEYDEADNSLIHCQDDCLLYQTSDSDAGAEWLKTQKNSFKDALIIDISECGRSELLARWDVHFNKETLRFSFSNKKGLLTVWLTEGRSVILKGRLNPDLEQRLIPLLLERLKNKAEGRLAIITEKPAFNGFKVQSIENEDILNFKRTLFPANDRVITEHELEALPLSKLRALRFQDNPWLGIRELDCNALVDNFSFEKSEEEAKIFMERRLEQITGVLANSPYVFLSGLTGVGKSSFVLQTYADKKDGTLYQGEEKIRDWASAKSRGVHYLFIDEANIINRDWSEFEGLFDSPPWVRVENERMALSDKHKVIFAGNPLSYGGERHLPRLFERHGGAVLFPPLSRAVIYENIIKPIFKDTVLNQSVEQIARPVFEVYDFLCRHSRCRLLITPRELKLMAQLTLSSCQLSIEQAAEWSSYYAYQVGKTLVESDTAEAFEDKFAKIMPPGVDVEMKEEAPFERLNHDEFVITESRIPVLSLLNDFLSQRNSQNPPGLGGIVLEGEPGIGKSDLIRNHLNQQGYKEVHLGPQNNHMKDDLEPEQAHKQFYMMPVSMQVKEKTRLLTEAFHQGAIVIVDEMNSSPMMERLLNNLLMGIGPDGKKAQQHGFLLISTQNPITMAGRRAPSNALVRRMLTLKLPDYTKEEMLSILTKRPDLQHNIAEILVSAYLETKALGRQCGKTPLPTFRDVLKIALQIEEANVNSRQETSSRLPKISGKRRTLPDECVSSQNAAKKLKHYSIFASSTSDQIQTTVSHESNMEFGEPRTGNQMQIVREDQIFLQWREKKEKEEVKEKACFIEFCNKAQNFNSDSDSDSDSEYDFR